MDRFRQIEPLLAVDISVDYLNRPDILRDVRFTLDRGEIAGVVGPSGAGKSTLALAIMRLVHLRGGLVRGCIRFDGRDLMALDPNALRRIRGREIALVPQSPVAALNPALKLETQLREVWRAHSLDPWREARDRVAALLTGMGLPAGAEFLRRYPRELSVGQAQRVAIAMAVMHRPQLLIADEPTSALDPGSRTGILDLFAELNRDLGVSILYISHDLASVERLCHKTLTISGQTHDLICA
jgi:peptide/nickel transport system ATP-binding protein